VRVLLPKGAQPSTIKLNGKTMQTGIEKVEKSTYAVLSAVPQGQHSIEIEYK
jgi:hypothetical protein